MNIFKLKDTYITLAFLVGLFSFTIVASESDGDSYFSKILNYWTMNESIVSLTGVMISTIAGIIVLYTSVKSSKQFHEKALHESFNKKILISHSHEDSDIAETIKNIIKPSGLNIHIMKDTVKIGENIKQRISKEIDASAMLIVLVSNNFTTSEWAQWELGYAMNNMLSEDKKTIPIIPILIDNATMPKSLQHIQYIKLEDEDELKSLIQRLPFELEQITGATISTSH